MDSLPSRPGAALYSSGQTVALVGAKELGHLFLVATVREEGPQTPAHWMMFHVGKNLSLTLSLNTLEYIFGTIHPFLFPWFPSSLPSPHWGDDHLEVLNLFAHITPPPWHTQVVMSDLHFLSHLAAWMVRGLVHLLLKMHLCPRQWLWTLAGHWGNMEEI